jgi:hypothetical protein
MPHPFANSLQLSLYRPLFDDLCRSKTELTVSPCMQQWRYSSTHLKFSSRFTPQPFYPYGRNPLFPLNRGWVGPEPVWALCKSAKYQSTVPARSLVTMATELPRSRPCLKAPQCDRMQWSGLVLHSRIEWHGFCL